MPIATDAMVARGKTVTFTATPDTGYQVKKWVINGSETVTSATVQTLTVQDTASAAVEFTPLTLQKYKVRFWASGGNGILKASVDGMPLINSPDMVEKGKTVTFTAHPSSGYQVRKWVINGSALETSDTVQTVTVEGDTSVMLNFTPQEYQVIFSVAGSNGTLKASVDGVPIATGDMVARDKTVTFRATPDTGYKVWAWSLNGSTALVTSDIVKTLTVQGETSAMVEFTPQEYRVLFDVLGGNGTLTASVDNVPIQNQGYVQYGKFVEFTAHPASGYKVRAWSLNGSSAMITSDTTQILKVLDDTRAVVEFTLISP